MKRIFPFFLMVLIGFQSLAQEYKPSEANLKARDWFEDARFGLFIHWGVYSILGDGEWVMHHQNISIDEYEKLPTLFNPVEYDPVEWVRMAKRAGMKYITITSRHHDGFSLFDSKATDYNIVKQTPYKKDVLKALSKACEQEGIKLFFYYSLLDWHDDNYFPRGRTGNGIKGRSEGDWNKYIDIMKAQLTELLTNYGEIGGIWFDGHWDKKNTDWHYEEIYQLVHDLQPHCLIGNNHHEGVKPGEDFQMFEKDLPGRATMGFATKAEDIGDLPKEVCETINGSWGFNLKDRKHKSDKELIQYLVKAAGYGSNLLLNVGPMPNGQIQPEHTQALARIGDWLETYGETIYGTTAGPFIPTDALAATQKGNRLFIHSLDQNAKVVFIPGFNLPVASIAYYGKKREAEYNLNEYGLLINIPESEKQEIDTVLEIILK
ncbi:MAG: alpha-L-fucosidase [Cyclobacteriaceae bacterium]